MWDFGHKILQCENLNTSATRSDFPHTSPDLTVFIVVGWLLVGLRFLSSVHLRVEEKISLTCGRDGGLQNMEVLGMVTLRVSDDKNGRIRLIINNNDGKGLQLQVGLPHIATIYTLFANFGDI